MDNDQNKTEVTTTTTDSTSVEVSVETKVDAVVAEVTKKAEPFRMVLWLIAAIILYTIASIMAKEGMDFYPQLQVVMWKLAHMNIAAYMGYWIDRHAFRRRLSDTSDSNQYICRAIIIAAAMLTIALGV